MLRSVSAIWAKQLHSSVACLICTKTSRWSEFRLSEFDLASGGLWSAFAAKGFKANGNVPLPCLIFVQKKRRLYITKVSETSMVVQVGLFVEGSATVRTLEFWGKQRLSHIATNPNQQPYTKIIWDVRHFTMSDSMTFPPEARLAALSCFCISAACRHDKWQVHFTWEVTGTFHLVN